MHLTAEPCGLVRITYTDAFTDEVVSRAFRAPAEGGYVRELADGDSRQVCERLAGAGDTLMASSDSLPGVIRGEYYRMRAAERALLVSRS